MPKTETFMCNKCHSVTDSFSSMEGLAHSCGGAWHYFDFDFYAQQSVQRINYWFAFMSFLAGLGVGYLLCILSTINR